MLTHSIKGGWNRVDSRHMHRHVNEVAFRLNQSNEEMSKFECLANFAERSLGKWLTIDRLVGKETLGVKESLANRIALSVQMR